MAGVLAAFEAYKESPKVADRWKARVRARLGLEVAQERAKGTTQDAIAEQLRRTREQVRRYEEAYREWVRDHPGDDLRSPGPCGPV